MLERPYRACLEGKCSECDVFFQDCHSRTIWQQNHHSVAYSSICLPLSVAIECCLYRSHANWPLNLIIRCLAIQPVNGQFRKLKPCSDFLILKSDFPRLLVEVNSTTTKHRPVDLVRMLLQGAAIVRFANKFLDKYQTKKDFVLIAIFIRDAGTATCYTLFQMDKAQDSQAVRYAVYKQAYRLRCNRFITKQRSSDLTLQLAVSNSRVTYTISSTC